MTSLWKSTIAAAPALERWIGGGEGELNVAHLPRAARPKRGPPRQSGSPMS